MALMIAEVVDLAPGVACVRLKGQVDSSNLERLKAAFDGCFERKIYRVVLNLKEAQYLSSSAIGCLIGAYTTAIKNGGRLILASTPLQVTEVLRLIGLTNVLRLVENEQAALSQI